MCKIKKNKKRISSNSINVDRTQLRGCLNKYKCIRMIFDNSEEIVLSMHEDDRKGNAILCSVDNTKSAKNQWDYSDVVYLPHDITKATLRAIYGKECGTWINPNGELEVFIKFEGIECNTYRSSLSQYWLPNEFGY